MARQYPEFPFGLEMLEPAVAYAAGHDRYTSEQMVEGLAAHYRLGHESLALRLRVSGRPAFHNYVDHLLSLWTRHGVHAALKEGIYQPTPLLGTIRDLLAERASHEVHALFLKSRRNKNDPRNARAAGRKPVEDRLSIPEEYLAELRKSRVARGDGAGEQAVLALDDLPVAGRPGVAPEPPDVDPPTAPSSAPEVMPSEPTIQDDVAKRTADEVAHEGSVVGSPSLAACHVVEDGHEAPRADSPVADLPPKALPDLRFLVRMSHDIASLRNLTPTMMASLDAAGVSSPQHLADLAPERLVAIVGKGALDYKGAYGVVMSARCYWLSPDRAAYGV